MKRRTVLLWLAASGCQVTPVPSVAPGHVSTVTLPVHFSRSPDLLEILLHQGLVVVEPGAELECELQVDITDPHPEHVASLAAEVRLRLDESPGHTTLGISHPEGAPLAAVHVRYRLRVPPDVSLRIETRDGNVHLRDFRGNAEVRSEGGFIEARMDGGSVSLTTVTGRIRLNGTYADASLRSESGEVEASIPESRTPVTLELVSTRGSVLVDLPAARSLDLDYRGDTGWIHSDMPLEWWSRDGDHRSGRIGRGETDARLVITNSTGPVRIRRSASALP